MKSKKLTFEGAHGDTLSARLDMPDEEQPEAFVLFAHCFTCSKNLKAVGNIARALIKKNMAVFRFDFTGFGESEGDFADTNFSSNIDDLVKATEYMETEFKGPDILVGHSLGGAAVLQAAHQVSFCKAVATLGAPCNPDHVKQNFALNWMKFMKRAMPMARFRAVLSIYKNNFWMILNNPIWMKRYKP